MVARVWEFVGPRERGPHRIVSRQFLGPRRMTDYVLFLGEYSGRLPHPDERGCYFRRDAPWLVAGNDSSRCPGCGVAWVGSTLLERRLTWHQVLQTRVSTWFSPQTLPGWYMRGGTRRFMDSVHVVPLRGCQRAAVDGSCMHFARRRVPLNEYTPWNWQATWAGQFTLSRILAFLGAADLAPARLIMRAFARQTGDWMVRRVWALLGDSEVTPFRCIIRCFRLREGRASDAIPVPDLKFLARNPMYCTGESANLGREDDLDGGLVRERRR